ncbi:MAG: Type 1 glutamine amidotransferase-like domain-containing protein [Dysgonamonadaceae bacterium]|jgi:dipeptidase E|nr:Type 1 glutamine amidotransferase-like domain-containing protein [Dysgonamonadaceae bacterium]
MMKTRLIIIANIVLTALFAAGCADNDKTDTTDSRNLFLASFFPDVADLLPAFVGEDITGKIVAYIPTAAKEEAGDVYEEMVNMDKSSFEKLGAIVDVLEITDPSLDQDEIKKRLTKADFIYVGGGNTFFLLQELKRNGTDKLIIEQIKNGKLYIGCSAGSIIAAKNIEYVSIMDPIEPAPELNGDYSAFGVVDFYIVPHLITNSWVPSSYEESATKTIEKYFSTLKLIPVTDNQVVTVKNGKVETLTITTM